MKRFEKGEITRAFYLEQIGALNLKADKAASRPVDDNEPVDDLPNVDGSRAEAEDSDSADSLSETRPAPVDSTDSDVDQEDPFAKDPVLQVGKKKTLPKGAPAKKQLCPVCKRGFQLKRNPPLHVACSVCQKLTHKRCIKETQEVQFVCEKCKPLHDEPPRSPGLASTGPGASSATSTGPEASST